MGRALWMGAIMAVVAPVGAAVAQHESHTVVLLEREHQTRIGDALADRLEGQPIRLVRRWTALTPSAERRGAAIGVLRSTGADAVVWLEEPTDAEPTVAAVGASGRLEEFPLRMRYAQVPPRVFAVVASYLLDQLGIGGVPSVQVEVEVVRDPALPSPAPAAAGARASEPSGSSDAADRASPGGASARDGAPEPATVPPVAGAPAWRLNPSLVGGAVLWDGDGAASAGLRVSLSRALEDGWSLGVAGSVGGLLGSTLPWLVGTELIVGRQPEPTGFGWVFGGGLLLARESRPGLQGANDARRLLGWQLGGRARWRWGLGERLGLAIEAGGAAGQLDGRWIVVPAAALTLELGL